MTKAPCDIPCRDAAAACNVPYRPFLQVAIELKVAQNFGTGPGNGYRMPKKEASRVAAEVRRRQQERAHSVSTRKPNPSNDSGKV